jgi:D-lactate dehydrogenase
MDVFFYEVFDEEERLLRKLLPGKIEAGFTAKTIQALRDRKPPADFISIRTQSTLPVHWSSALQGILARSEGFDHLINFRQRSQTKAALGHLSGYCSRSVAEQALMLMFALVRKLPRQISQFEIFYRDGLTGCEVQGKNALVLGVGKIGHHIVQLARGVGLNVKGVDIVKREKKLEYITLKHGLAWADLIFCALPLTSKTKGFLSYTMLSHSTRKPFLVNIGRGEVVPLTGLIRLLKEKKLSGVALDVFPDEGDLAERLRLLIEDIPCVEQLNELRSFENVICTPHNAFNTAEGLVTKCQQTVEAVEMFLAIKRFPHMTK